MLMRAHARSLPCRKLPASPRAPQGYFSGCQPSGRGPSTSDSSQSIFMCCGSFSTKLPPTETPKPYSGRSSRLRGRGAGREGGARARCAGDAALRPGWHTPLAQRGDPCSPAGRARRTGTRLAPGCRIQDLQPLSQRIFSSAGSPLAARGPPAAARVTLCCLTHAPFGSF